MSNDLELSLEDAMGLADKIMEMADRVKRTHAFVPGAQATWVFECDDTRYRVTLSVAGAASPTARDK